MVLDDASPQASESSPSDYISSDSTSPFVKYYPLQINPELVTHPDLFTLYFGFFGKWNWNRKFTNNLAQRIENARVLVQRSPTQDELDAFVAHTSRSVYYQRMGAPLGCAAGSAWLLYQARKSERFPLYAPGYSGQGDAPVTPRMLFEAGRNFMREDPMLAKQLLKMSGLKLFLWTFLGSAFSSVGAVWVDTTSTMTDPRLKQFVTDVRSQNPEEVKRRKIEAATERSRSRSARKQQQQEEEGLPLEEGQVQEYSGLAAERQDKEQRVGYESTYSQVDSSPRRVPPTASAQEQSGEVGFFDYEEDDASPTAPEYRSQNKNYASGSAWDRIRQQNQGSESTQTPVLKPSSRHPASQDDSWGSAGGSSSANDSQRDSQREREQAQANFDRLIESERNIPGDGESNRQGKGWGKWS